jgi:hypothetical protein
VIALRGRLLTPGTGGALLSINTRNIWLQHTLLEGNFAELSGGAAHLQQAILNMDNCSLGSNLVRTPEQEEVHLCRMVV